jgi:hypothetical protein
MCAAFRVATPTCSSSACAKDSPGRAPPRPAPPYDNTSVAAGSRKTLPPRGAQELDHAGRRAESDSDDAHFTDVRVVVDDGGAFPALAERPVAGDVVERVSGVDAPIRGAPPGMAESTRITSQC